MSILRMALETVVTEECLDDRVPEGDEQDVALLADAALEGFDNVLRAQAACETIHDYHDQLTGLINAKQVSPVTTGLILQGVNFQLNSVGLESISMIAVENYQELDGDTQARAALEAIGTALKATFMQDPTLNFKHWKDIVSDSFRGIPGKVKKYEQKTLENKAEFRAKSSSMGTSIDVNATGLWYFFRTAKDAHPGKNIMGLITKDIGMSKYVLTVYTKEIVALITKFASVVGGGDAKSIAGLRALAKKVDALPKPVDLFDKNILAGAYFNVSGFHIHGNVVKQEGSFSHGASKAVWNVGRQALGAHVNVAVTAVTAAMMPDMTFTRTQVGDVFDAAQAYLDNVNGYLTECNHYNTACDTLAAAFKHYSDAAESAGQFEGKEGTEARQVSQKLTDYGNTLSQAFVSPAYHEASRSLRGSKYCNYLGLRAISNG